MKLIVETVDDTQVHTPQVDQWVHSDRPSIIFPSIFMDSFIGKGVVKILAQVADTASDADFVDCWKSAKGDKALAIASYVSEHPVLDEGAEVVKPPKPPKPPKVEA